MPDPTNETDKNPTTSSDDGCLSSSISVPQHVTDMQDATNTPSAPVTDEHSKELPSNNTSQETTYSELNNKASQISQKLPHNKQIEKNEVAAQTDVDKSEKIKVHFVAVGSAPILKKTKFLMAANDRFAVAMSFVRKVLKLSTKSTATVCPSVGGVSGASSSSLFLYVNAAFVPSPEERMGDLYDCFGVRGELVVHYSLQEAWG